MNQFKLQKKKGDGTFSQVFMAKSVQTGEYFAVKCIKDRFQSLEDVLNNVEIQALKKLSPHDNIIRLIKVLYDQPTQKLALIFQLMDMNLYQCLSSKKSELTHKKIKFYMFQLLKAIAHIHKKGIFHRDIKPENVLVKGDIVKLADFGSCEKIKKDQPHTSYIATRWYRPPECLLTDGFYDYKMDIWGFGCVLFEMISKYPLFPGKSEVDQVHKIHSILGTPSEELLDFYQSRATHMQFDFPFKKGTGIERLLPKGQKDLLDLLVKCLAYDPKDRITAEAALKHTYFSEIHQLFAQGKDEERESQKLLRNTHLTSLTQNIFHGSLNDSPEKKNMEKRNSNQSNLSNLQKDKILKKTKQQKQCQQSSLPPINQVRLDLRLNVYGNATIKLESKKPTLLKKKQYSKQSNATFYPLMGKKIDRF